MSESNMRIVEIGGVKMEVDMRHAKMVEHYRVGDPVKVLLKEYGDTFSCSPGIIVGFADFKQRPAIEVLYLHNRYGVADMKLVSITKDTENVEIAPMSDYETGFDRAQVMESFAGQIRKLQEEIRAMVSKRAAFDEFFGKLMPVPVNAEPDNG